MPILHFRAARPPFIICVKLVSVGLDVGYVRRACGQDQPWVVRWQTPGLAAVHSLVLGQVWSRVYHGLWPLSRTSSVPSLGTVPAGEPLSRLRAVTLGTQAKGEDPPPLARLCGGAAEISDFE